MENKPAEVENIDALDEIKILGYFETIRSVFLAKLAMLVALKDPDPNVRNLFQALIVRSAEAVTEELGDLPALQALRNQNPEIVLNLHEDTITAILLSSWAVFEQIIKDIPNPNYSRIPSSINADFRRRKFGFTNKEKDTIAVFYHIRNAIMRYNGAYHAYKMVDHTYHGTHFKSAGHIGEKIIVSVDVAYQTCKDLETYSMKAWTNAVNAPS
jgi:hypothetical protein